MEAGSTIYIFIKISSQVKNCPSCDFTTTSSLCIELRFSEELRENFSPAEWAESLERSDGIISITDQPQRDENATAAGFYLSSGIGCKI